MASTSAPFFVWKSVAEHLPEMLPSDFGWQESRPVLGYDNRDNFKIVKLVEQEDATPVWRTCDSEGWDVTDSITHWKSLPVGPNK